MNTPDALLDGLDEAQRQAASSIDGPVRIIACAGAGKTRTITRRIAYGCATGQWDPSRVLAVTFSVKAAQEMRSRLLDLGVGEGIQVATFHAAALHQLQDVWEDIVDGPFPYLVDHPRELVTTAMVRALGEQPEPRVVQDVHAEIDWCKVSLITPEQYAHVCTTTHRLVPGGLDPKRFSQIYEQYEQEKSAQLAIDFHDILLMLAHVMDAFPDVAQSIRSRIGWLTVDEYQDVSPLQHLVMKSWLGSNRNICVVGDPAQTIYSFAGATSYYLQHFRKEFAPLSADIALRTDYRSIPPIVDHANAVLRRSPLRNDYLPLQAHKEGTTQVTRHMYDTDEAEALGVVRQIEQLRKQGVHPKDCAILTRLHGQQSIVVRALREAGIPYQVRKDSGWQQSALVDPAVNDGSVPDTMEAVKQGRVTVSTIHASKGLEFKHVFLIGLSDGLLPYHASDDMDHVEEERRILYVGVTRAEDTLHLSFAQKQDERRSKPRVLSRFLR